jgi:hypothetical protein
VVCGSAPLDVVSEAVVCRLRGCVLVCGTTPTEVGSEAVV